MNVARCTARLVQLSAAAAARERSAARRRDARRGTASRRPLRPLRLRAAGLALGCGDSASRSRGCSACMHSAGLPALSLSRGAMPPSACGVRSAVCGVSAVGPLGARWSLWLPGMELHGHRAPPQLSPLATAADRSFASGLTPPLWVHWHLQARFSRRTHGARLGGRRDRQRPFREHRREHHREHRIDGACDPMGPLPMGCASGQSGRARLGRARVVHRPLAP